MAEHIARHKMMDSGRRWLAEGMGYVVDDECPFCGRDDLQSLPLIQAYRVAFDEAFMTLEAEIEELEKAADNSIGEVAQERLRTLEVQNRAALEYWQNHCAAPDLPALDGAIGDIAKAYEVVAALIGRKKNQPHKGITREEGIGEALDLLARATNGLEQYGNVIEAANTIIEERKKVTAQGNLHEAQGSLVKLEATKRRHEGPSIAACNEFQRLVESKKAIEDGKARVRKDLEAHTREVIEPYEDQINHYLELFNAGFRIVRTRHGYPGGIATSSYQLLIDNHYVDLGDAKTPVEQPSFKNTLSAGDRMTLGLAIFLAQLDHEERLADWVFVFDDPFSSQDAFRRRQTIYEIIRVARDAAQVIVLSHDAQFLKQLWEKCPAENRSALQISVGPSGSKIAAFDLETACRGRVAGELDALMAFRATGAGNLYEVIRKLRIVLETHFRTMYPNAFLPDDNLGDIIRKIREGGADHPAAEHYDNLDRINDYTAGHHRGEDPGDLEPAPDYTELQGFVGLTLRIVNALPA